MPYKEHDKHVAKAALVIWNENWTYCPHANNYTGKVVSVNKILDLTTGQFLKRHVRDCRAESAMGVQLPPGSRP